jgi:hypothetical protein
MTRNAFPSALGIVLLTGTLLTSSTEAQTDQTGPTWTEKFPASSPSPRVGAAMAYDSARGEVVLFGGSDFSTQFGDTWVWNGTTWTQRFSAIAPRPRAAHAMAYDAARGQIVLFGGVGSGAVLNDTWVWDGSTWTQKFPASVPPGRFNCGFLAYDAARQQVVMFGCGTSIVDKFDDTWVWDGTDWTKKFPPISPEARTAHTMAYDAGRAEVVLFGGAGIGDPSLDDTWVWSGTTWTQRFPAASPPIPRWNSGMAFDTLLNQVVLFGGSGPLGTDLKGDTWGWDGTDWTEQFPATSPPPRLGHAMAYDSARGEIVLFVGATPTGLFGDTWVWSVVPACSADSDCDDGNVCTDDSCNLATGACVHAPVPGCQPPPPQADLTLSASFTPPTVTVGNTSALDVSIVNHGPANAKLGSLSKVIDDDIERRLRQGIRHKDADRLAGEIEAADLDAEKKRVTEEEFEAARERQEDLKAQIAHCQNLLEASREWVGFESEPFRDALSCSLELLGAKPLEESRDEHGNRVWRFPRLDRRAEADASWAATLDTLRTPRPQNQKLADWRREAEVRPVVFEDAGVLTEDTVHLHLEQRVAQRLLARFRSQGFIHHDLSRACLAQSADSIPRVILLGRLSLYGRGAERLHEELVPLAARWVEPSQRKGTLTAYAREAEAKTLDLLDRSLGEAHRRLPGDAIQKKLLAAAAGDISELLPQLEPRARELAKLAIEKLGKRGEREEKDLRATLERQRDRVREELARTEPQFQQLTLGFDDDERRQLESDMRSWRTRLQQFDRDLEREPRRIREFYEVRAERVEPVGLVYLWPETN